jgi:tRNA 2-thiouridine synthesizing protein A
VSEPPRIVDARGMLCPWPVLRLSRAAREVSAGGTIRILADDPTAPRELALLCAERGWGFSTAMDQDAAFDVLIA